MKIAWFTPFFDNSAIGKYSRAVARALRSYGEVDLWVPRGNGLLATNLTVYQFTAGDNLSEKLKHYDFIVYNLGDHYGFHNDIYQISSKYRGVIVLHDYIMHHFFYAYYLIHEKKPDAYIRDMTLYYGTDGNKVANDLVQGKAITGWETEIMKYPFFEKAIDGALGVVCHSLFLAEKVSSKILSPINVLKLPYYHDPSIADVKLDKEAWGIPDNKTLMVTLGHVNPNKRIAHVIECLGKNKKLRDKIIYVIIGAYDHNPLFQDYVTLVNNHGLRDSVMFLGYQPDPILHAFMRSADIFVNLRYPVMEGGSASLVEQMSYGKPVIVCNSGHYSELPVEAVVKIRVEHEEEDLVAALEMLIDNDSKRIQIGKRGIEFVSEECNVDTYCQAIINYLDELKKWMPLLDLTDKVAEEFTAMGVSPGFPAIDIVAEEIFGFLNKGSE